MIDFQDSADEVSLLDVLHILVVHLRSLMLLSVGAFALTFGSCLLITPDFSASVRFLPPQQQQSLTASMLASLGALSSFSGNTIGGLKNPTDQYVSFLKSNSLQDALIERFHLSARYETPFKADTRMALSRRVRIQPSKDGLITVDVDDRSAAMAAELANAHVEELQKLLGRLAVTEAQQKRIFFENQLNQTKDRLTAAEVTLKATGININVLKSSPQLAVEAVAKMKAAVTAQEVKTASMRGYLADSAPDFKQAMTELGVLRQQLARLSQDEPRASTLPIDSDYISKFREFKYQETLFELFSKQYELAKLDEAREGAVIQVLDPAQVPERPSSPQKFKIALSAALITLMLALVWIFLSESFRRMQRNSQDQMKWQSIVLAFKRTLGLK